MPRPKLSPEEMKIRRQEKRAERRRLAEARRRRIEQDRLAREVKYGNLTTDKHEKRWRKMLISIALPKMRTELEYAWHNFERTIDAKDFTISLLMDELRDAEEQYQRNVRSHMDNIDKLIILCYDQIEELKAESKNVILNLYNAATFERADIVGITKENEEYLKTMLYMLDNQRKESEKLIRGEYLSKQEVELSKLNEICSKFTEELETKYDKLWKDTHAFLNRRQKQTAVRRQQYFEMQAQDETMQKIIRQQWNKIQRHLDVIKMLKIQLNDRTLVQSRKIQELLNERNHFEEVYKSVKKQLEQERILDEKNLTLLTLQSNNIIRELVEIEQKGEKILKLSAICRKYETLEEKTMSFPTFFDDRTLKKIEGITGGLLQDVEGLKPELELFWNRIGQADALRYEMNEESVYLRLKNKRLRNDIHEYCLCLNCDEETKNGYLEHQYSSNMRKPEF